MNSEDKFFAWMWLVGGTVIISVVIGMAAYHINYTNKVAEMVNGGADPIGVACALAGYDRITCSLRTIEND